MPHAHGIWVMTIHLKLTPFLHRCSSCTVAQDMSNYWVPNLYYKAQNGSFISVNQNGGATIYYLQRSDPADANYPHLEAFPEGFQMVAGDPSLRSFNDTLEQNAVTFTCLGTNEAETNGFPNYKCPYGLRAQVFFPSCWNGVDLDSPDHKSHMAYPSGVDRRSNWLWVPWRFCQWTAVDNCNAESGVIEECPYFDFITDTTAQNCVIPPSVDEQVFGIMPKLPGCNDLQEGPAKAKAQSECGATTQIGQPQLPYVDLTSSKGFAYVGCGSDPAGQSRTLQGVQVDNATAMTIEYCVDYCVSQGFSVAGKLVMNLRLGNGKKCDGSSCANVGLPIINGSVSTNSAASSSAGQSSPAAISATSSSVVLPTSDSIPATSSSLSTTSAETTPSMADTTLLTTTSAETTPLMAATTLLTTTSISIPTVSDAPAQNTILGAGHAVSTDDQSSGSKHHHTHTHKHRTRSVTSPLVVVTVTVTAA
ncbi:hypothetical protein LOCC1_G003619 [Lachnellula occidentalis]|uniref:DUF1996 domain-containing protein n=1 Tax=Lachnellula occidentalis TaxID=215460 RepID=A0A8H8UDZ9_9HELO|nr:hypothetical protein LOCC1_G003619 [Lachnellula occidentalis]